MTDHKEFFDKLKYSRVGMVDKHGLAYGGCYCTVEELYQAFKSRYEEEMRSKNDWSDPSKVPLTIKFPLSNEE